MTVYMIHLYPLKDLVGFLGYLKGLFTQNQNFSFFYLTWCWSNTVRPLFFFRPQKEKLIENCLCVVYIMAVNCNQLQALTETMQKYQCSVGENKPEFNNFVNETVFPIAHVKKKKKTSKSAFHLIPLIYTNTFIKYKCSFQTNAV